MCNSLVSNFEFAFLFIPKGCYDNYTGSLFEDESPLEQYTVFFVFFCLKIHLSGKIVLQSIYKSFLFKKQDDN